MKPKIIFESPTVRDKRLIFSFLKKGAAIYILEPFHAYHHRGAIRFFPPPLPGYIDDLLEKNRLKLITAREINAHDLYAEAADRAVGAVEEVYPVYRKAIARAVRFLSDEIGTDVEMAFKKNLCDRLGGFYSVNILMQRLKTKFGIASLEVFPHCDVAEYGYFCRLLKQNRYEIFDDKEIVISPYVKRRARIKNVFLRTVLVIKIAMQAAGGLIVSIKNSKKASESICRYKYGISIIAPKRQFRGNQRGVDFLVDNDKIKPEDIAYIPLVAINGDQKQKILKLGSDVLCLPRLGRYFSNWKTWAKLAFFGIQKKIFPSCDLIELVAISLFTWYRWRELLKKNRFENFITHSDFPHSHVARNIALSRKGTTTWYFTDASNFGHSFRIDDALWNCHPFWAYQNYDHLITWNKDLAEFFSRHPDSYKQTHVVGSLWSSHVDFSTDRSSFLKQYFKEDRLDNKFVIVAYSSTYTVNGMTSYGEGIEFAKHLEALAEQFDDVLILLKEKKDPSFHLRVDPQKGQELVNLYERMNKHQRITIGSNRMDASQAMGICDLCISFPYTSTTNEAIGYKIPSIWHDPKENYRKTPYAKHGNLVTHGYLELKTKVMEMKLTEAGICKDTIIKGSPLFDPYRDGKAIDRFRDLLCQLP